MSPRHLTKFVTVAVSRLFSTTYKLFVVTYFVTYIVARVVQCKRTSEQTDGTELKT